MRHFLATINTFLLFRPILRLTFFREVPSREISKLSRYALQAIVIPDFYTRKVGPLGRKVSSKRRVYSMPMAPVRHVISRKVSLHLEKQRHPAGVVLEH